MQFSLCAVSVVVLTAAGLASGAIVEANFDGVSPSVPVRLFLEGVDHGQGHSGVYRWTRTGGDFAGLQDHFASFCIEITQNISGGNNYVYETNTIETAPIPSTLLVPMGASKADRVRELFGRIGGFAVATGLDDVHASALQMALWEVVYEPVVNPLIYAYDVNVGTIYFGDAPAVSLIAQGYLDALDGTGYRDTDLFAISSETVQDQLVPAPGTMGLVGFAGIVALRRRR